MQAQYRTEYEKQKPDKKLRYVPNMGTVDLVVEMDSGETLEVTVNPLQAAIIELFSMQSALKPRSLHAVTAYDGSTNSLIERRCVHLIFVFVPL
jgi:hypothetical protein